jgi:hypothetical protein
VEIVHVSALPHKHTKDKFSDAVQEFVRECRERSANPKGASAVLVNATAS